MSTVRVRICVVVDEEGNWTCAGWYKAPDRHAEQMAFFDPNGAQSIHWVEADVPLPESKTIEGKVVA